MEQHFPFQASPLPFGYVSLMPHCDANTLYYHHDDFLAKEIHTLNNLVVHHRLSDRSLTQLVTEDFNLPAAQLRRLKSAAGAVFNHQLYFGGMACRAGQPPFNRLTEAITATYGSMAQFQRLLTGAAESIIGSGWVWLVAEGNKGIHIATTENNDVVALGSVSPVLVLDMWEHAYQAQYHFDMAGYVNTWFSFIDWPVAEARYLAALSGASAPERAPTVPVG